MFIFTCQRGKKVFSSNGATLLELLVGVGISLLLFGMVIVTLTQGFTAFRLSKSQTASLEAGRGALDKASPYVRSANFNPTVSENGNALSMTRLKQDGTFETLVMRKEGDLLNLTDFTGSTIMPVGYNVQDARFALSGFLWGAARINLESGNERRGIYSLSVSPRPTNVFPAGMGPGATLTCTNCALRNGGLSVSPNTSPSLNLAWTNANRYALTVTSNNSTTLVAESSWNSANDGNTSPGGLSPIPAGQSDTYTAFAFNGNSQPAQTQVTISAALPRLFMVRYETVWPWEDMKHYIDANYGTNFYNASITDKQQAQVSPGDPDWLTMKVYNEFGGYYNSITVTAVNGNISTGVTADGATWTYGGGSSTVLTTPGAGGEMHVYTGALPTLTIDGITYDVLGYVWYSPIILDLTGSNTPDVANGEWLPHPHIFYKEWAKMFDISGEGYFMWTEWVGPQSGLLCTLDEYGKVSSALNLFGTAGGWKDGYVKLATLFDRDKNGVVEGGELEGLYVWRDENRNGISEDNELDPVQGWGITRIWTKHDKYRALYERNGKYYFTWDWWPNAAIIRKKTEAELKGYGTPNFK